jgi:hypothetical protein
MKVVHQTFEDQEHEQLVKAKGDKNWHDFIMELVR